MRKERRVASEAHQAVEGIKNRGLGPTDLLKCLELAKELRVLMFAPDPHADERLRESTKSFVRTQCELTANIPQDLRLDATSLSFLRSGLPAVAMIFTIESIFCGFADAILEFVPGGLNDKTDHNQIGPKRHLAHECPLDSENRDGTRTVSAEKKTDCRASAQPSSNPPLPQEAIAQASPAGIPQITHEPNSSAVETSSKVTTYEARLAPLTIREANRTDLGRLNSPKQETTSVAIDFSPEQSADNPVWVPHEGAVIKTDGSPYPYYSGRGVRRLAPPQGCGPVRLEAGYLWRRSSLDGLWCDTTVRDRQVCVELAEKNYFEKFDQPSAIPTSSPLLPSKFGCLGVGQDLRALRDLAAITLPSSPYGVILFDQDGGSPSIEAFELQEFAAEEVEALSERNYLELLGSSVPRTLLTSRPVLRLQAIAEPDFEEAWPHAKPIPDAAVEALECGIPLAPIDEVASLDDPPYAKAARSIRFLRNGLRGRQAREIQSEIESLLISGHSLAFSGPAGSGKSHLLIKMVEFLSRNATWGTRQTFYYLNIKRRPRWMSSYDIYGIQDIDRMVKVAADGVESSINILIADEYSDLSADHLSKMSPFHQVLFFGDYAQSSCQHRPVFDFVHRCGGVSRVARDVWRAKATGLFDAVSLISYSGAYKAIPGPRDLIGFDYRDPMRVLFCPDDPQAEVVAMWCVAKVLLDARCRVTMVVDGPEAMGAAAALTSNNRYPGQLLIKSSKELRGLECDVIIFSTASLDRQRLSTAFILELLTVIFSRPTIQVNIVLPDTKEVVGSAARRCTCLVQPLLCYRVAPIALEPSEYTGLSDALAAKDIKLYRMRHLLVALRAPKIHCLILLGEPYDDDPAVENVWKGLHVTIDSALLRKTAEELLDDVRFTQLVTAIEALALS